MQIFAVSMQFVRKMIKTFLCSIKISKVVEKFKFTIIIFLKVFLISLPKFQLVLFFVGHFAIIIIWLGHLNFLSLGVDHLIHFLLGFAEVPE